MIEKAGKDLNNEYELFDKDFQEMQEATLKVKEAQRFAETAQEQIYDRRERYQRLSEEHAVAEEFLNEGLGCISEIVRDSSAATLYSHAGPTIRTVMK